MDPLKALAAVRKALGLEDTAGPNETMQAFASQMQNAPPPEKEEEAPEAEKVEDAPPPPDEVIPADASVKPRIELVDDGADRERVKSLVAAAVRDGKVTEAGLEGAVRFATAAPDDFAAWAEAAPVLAPAAGQVVKASAADRATASDANRLTAKYRNERAAARPHFTQRGN